MKIKFKIFLLIGILFLSSCGFKPIYSSKGQNFTLGNVNLVGEKKLVKYFDTRIKRFKGDSDKKYDLDVKLDVVKNIISKDKKGDPSIFSIQISLKMLFKQPNKTNISKTFVQNTTYNNIANKFDLKKHEKSLEKQLTDKIIEDFISYIQSIQ